MLVICRIFRRYLVKTIIGITVFGFPDLTTADSLIHVNKKPNVILILTDDQGYGDLACHGNPIIKTPNLDELYHASLRFTDFHVSPFCSPTRAQLLTGRYPSRAGVWHSVKGRSLIHRDEVTTADVFRYNGYKTAIFGKWHLGDNYPFRPQDRGFDEVLVHGGGGIGNTPDYWANDYFDDTYYHNGKPEKYKGYCTDIWFEEGMKFIEKNKNEQFFVYLSTNAPHLPYVVAEKYRKMYPGIETGLQEFYGMITNIDDNIGRLREKLRKLKLEDNTILIFITDNGSSRGSEIYNAGMRGGKGAQWDGGHRVPFFIYWPEGDIQKGRDIEVLTSGIDLLPTLIEVCQLNRPQGPALDGRSLVPLIKGKFNKWKDRTIVVDNQRVTYPMKYRRTTVMTNRWRWVDGRELYDIRQDPAQKNNVVDLFPDVVNKLKPEYEEWWKDVYQSTKNKYEIIIGSDKENPSFLTAHDLHGAAIWNHDQVLSGKKSGGYWEIFVENDGQYEISLRRWPKEFNHPITSEPLVPANLKYLIYHSYHNNLSYSLINKRGIKIPATQAQITIGGQYLVKKIPEYVSESNYPDYETNENGQVTAVNFRIELKRGSTKLSAWFVNGQNDGDINGAYYVYATKL